MTNKTPKWNLTADYSSDWFLSPVYLFSKRYDAFPSVIEIINYFDMEVLIDYLTKKYKVEQKDIIASYIRDKYGKLRIGEGLFFLKEGLAIQLDVSQGQIETEYEKYENHFVDDSKSKKKSNPEHFKIDITIFYDPLLLTKEEANELMSELLKFKVEPKRKSELKFLCVEDGELTLKALEIKKPEIDIALNYGKEFKELYDYMCSKLTGDTNKNKGLILFHGKPGTGKTTLIKFLINELSDKKQIIYMPPDMVNELSNPKFLPFLISHQNSILVIEDGESVIKSRKGGQNQAVSNLLNMADGLLSDALNIQVICTFNCGITDVDEALLRKGRLIAKHEFKALSKEDAQLLLDSLNVDYKATKEMTLADIYNYQDQNFEEEKKNVGFNI